VDWIGVEIKVAQTEPPDYLRVTSKRRGQSFNQRHSLFLYFVSRVTVAFQYGKFDAEGANNAARGSRGLDIWGGPLIYAPKAARGLSPGFQPWEPSPQAMRPEGAADQTRLNTRGQ
jgi:hypothetical protein